MDHDEPSLALLWDTFTGYQRTAAMKAADRAGCLHRHRSGATTLPELAARCGARRAWRARAAEPAGGGRLPHQGRRALRARDGRGDLPRPQLARVRRLDDQLPRLADDRAGFTTSSPRRCGAAARRSPTQGSLAPDHPVWVEFARAMAPRRPHDGRGARRHSSTSSRPVRGRCSTSRRGTGMFGITLARHNPDVR